MGPGMVVAPLPPPLQPQPGRDAAGITTVSPHELAHGSQQESTITHGCILTFRSGWKREFQA
jgi:hypothetical protein